MNQLKLSYRQILDILSQNNLLVEHNIKNTDGCVEFISHDSRNITQNTLFFCKGAGFKEEYLYDAIKKGAVCYVKERNELCRDELCSSADIAQNSRTNAVRPYNIIVNDIRRSIAIIAPMYYNYPYKNLNLIGVTGTKGKTTVAYFLHNILNNYAKSRTGLSTSIEKYTGKRSEEAHLNTPEPCDLQRYFHEAAESGIKYFTMEVSSQAYKTGRVDGIKFDNGIFLNISEDHIGPLEHEDFEDYLNCKLELMKNSSNIVINRETDCFKRVLEAARFVGDGALDVPPVNKQITLFGSEKIKNECDYYYTDVKKDRNLTHFNVKSDRNNYSETFTIKTPGLFNVENALAAITLCKTPALNIDDGSIRAGLFETTVPGRMNILDNGDITVIIDYAHNLLSFSKLYESIALDYAGRKIISVGGSPGGKAFKRRRDFAETVGKSSDYIYLTAEDPQYEDAAKICEEMTGYIPDTPREIIIDRAEAVRTAIMRASPGDVVVLLGKGTEEYQKINGKWEFYASDYTIALQALSEKEPEKYRKAVNK